MAVHKLVLDDVFEEALFSLIAIHCTIEDYRLAYLLNKHLGINLVRKPVDLDFNNGKLSYSIYEWEDCKQLTSWNLVSNICKAQEAQPQQNQQSLFNIQGHITKTHHLIPEYKSVNYFLKINSDNNFSKEAFILSNILNIPQVATAFSVDANQLKSKDNLIFN